MNDLARRAHSSGAKTGVLLVNLGTPEAPTPQAIRRYLAQFLGDPRVVEIPRLIWLPILYGLILTLRPRRLAHAYQSIWTERGSPLLAISQDQLEGVRVRLQAKYGERVSVALAMTYGEPSLPKALQAFAEQQVRRVVVLPLYPQYSGSTTGAVADALFKALMGQRWVPELRTIGSYHDHPAYIEALAASVREHWQRQGRGDHLLMSFHGVPQHYVTKGDPYYCHCQKTGRLLAESLGLQGGDYTVAFQSRFGKAPWVQPYTQDAVKTLPGRGVKQLDVICPGFSADCLETLEEVSQGYDADFRAAGGSALRYIPALNAGDGHLDALISILMPVLNDAAAQPQPVADAARRADNLADAFSGRSA